MQDFKIIFSKEVVELLKQGLDALSANLRIRLKKAREKKDEKTIEELTVKLVLVEVEIDRLNTILNG
jgi:hypothetical protein